MAREFGQRPALPRMHEFRCKLAKRLEHECALVQPRMGNAETGLITTQTSVEQKIEIEEAWSPAHRFGVSTAPRFDFDLEQRLEQSAGRLPGLHFHDRVEVGPLLAGSDRIRFVYA